MTPFGSMFTVLFPGPPRAKDGQCPISPQAPTCSRAAVLTIRRVRTMRMSLISRMLLVWESCVLLRILSQGRQAYGRISKGQHGAKPTPSRIPNFDTHPTLLLGRIPRNTRQAPSSWVFAHLKTWVSWLHQGQAKPDLWISGVGIPVGADLHSKVSFPLGNSDLWLGS